MKVLHVITGLDQGGAEAVLYQLIAATPEIRHRVVCLQKDGVNGQKLREIGVEVEALDMSRGKFSFSGLRRLQSVISTYRPDVVQTRLYHADLLGGVAAFFARVPVVWAVHSTELGTVSDTWKTRVVRRVNALLSGVIPAAIVTDAQRSAQVHASLRYDRTKLVTIPNGVDQNVFDFDPALRHLMRQEISALDSEFLIGLVGRWHPLKDHANLLNALAILKANQREFRCVLAGTEMTSNNNDLMDIVHHLGLDDHIILLGPRSDVPAVMNALDLHVLSSSAESLPVAVIEAMACGVPCVVTDVGDAALIVGDTGWVVPPCSARELATGIEMAMAMLGESGKEAQGMLCRSRIIEHFSLATMKRRYTELWRKIAIAGRKSHL